jgi:ribosomal protein S18 acetylase RimI-like enzyme
LTIDRQLSIRELTLADASGYRDIRLEGLRLAPEAFGSSYEEEISRGDEEFARRITGRPGIMFGGFEPGAAGAAGLVGTAGCYCDNAVKSRHKLHLVGMYVRPVYRGRGLGARLIERILQHARQIGGIAVVQLGVGCDNHAARALYDRMGFKTYGIERKALKIGERFIDEELRAIEI